MIVPFALIRLFIRNLSFLDKPGCSSTIINTDSTPRYHIESATKNIGASSISITPVNPSNKELFHLLLSLKQQNEILIENYNELKEKQDVILSTLKKNDKKSHHATEVVIINFIRLIISSFNP